MFYCNQCAEKNGYPKSIGRSIGVCEICGTYADCNDVPSSQLPKPKDLFSKFAGTSLFPDKKNEEIEDLAWQIFKDRLGLSFKRELTPDEMKEITNVPDYQQYRDAAKKLYTERLLKKEKAALNKKYQIIDVQASGKPTWSGGAYTLCFVYSKYNGNFILRGYCKEVEEYLKKNYTHYFYNMSLWYHGANRDIWHFWKNGVGIHKPSRNSRLFKGKDKWKFQVRPYTNWHDDDETKKLADEKAMWFKRMPKRWIPEFDTL